MKWAVIYIIDRTTQDDRKSKVHVEALFSSPSQAQDNYIIRNEESKRYILHVDDLEEFEEVYNNIQDLNENYGEYAIFHLRIFILHYITRYIYMSTKTKNCCYINEI